MGGGRILESFCLLLAAHRRQKCDFTLTKLQLQVPEDLEEGRGSINEVRRKAEGKEQNSFVVTDQTGTSAGHGHLRGVRKCSFRNLSFLQKKRGGKKKSGEKERRDEELKIWVCLKIYLSFFPPFPKQLHKPFGAWRGGRSEAVNEALPCAGLNTNTQSDHNSGCNSSHTVCLSVDSEGCIKAWQRVGTERG